MRTISTRGGPRFAARLSSPKSGALRRGESAYGRKRVGTAGAALLVAALAASAAMMSVQVKEAPLRATPSFVGKVVGGLAYGDRVEVREKQGDWSKVEFSGQSGWLHNSALSAKKIVLASGQEQAKVAASGDELALAGKGFNSDVEAQFKAAHREIDFRWIDRMEKISIPASESQAFLKEGHVLPKEGGTK